MQIKTTIGTGFVGLQLGLVGEKATKKNTKKSHAVVEQLSKVGLSHLKILTRSTLQNRTKLTIAEKKG